MPSNIAMMPMIAKYSQPAPAAASGEHSEKAIAPKMPPRSPAMISTNMAIYAIVPAFERALFLFVSKK